MKITHVLTAGVLLVSATLAGCNSSQTAAVDKIIAQVQAATVTACAVEPTAASVATIIATLNPVATAGVAVATGIADQICKAVAAVPATSTTKVGAGVVPASVMVNGIKVEFEPVGTAK